jgi:two-component system, LytTR family, response regulator
MIRAVIVDDESKSLSNLKFLIEHNFPEVQVAGTASNALEAVAIIVKEKPEVVFLDIQMPGHSGFDVVEQISDMQVKIVFTTAHRDYAIQAIKKGAFDYLLKPIDTDDLKKCIDRISSLTEAERKNFSAPIQLNVKEGVIFINPSEIIKLKASGSYTEIYLDNNVKITASKVLKDLEALLDPDLFYRCHNSYLLNLSKLKKLLKADGYCVEFKDGSRAEVSKKNKDELLEKMNKLTEE